MISNYNVIQLDERTASDWKEGDVFEAPDSCRDWRITRFNGLVIQSITYGFGVFLHFDLKEWSEAKPPKDQWQGGGYQSLSYPAVHRSHSAFISHGKIAFYD